MIKDLMSKAEFKKATEVDYNRRWASMTAIGRGVATAHAANGAVEQHKALVTLLKLTYTWKREYKTRNPTKTWQASRRAAGVTGLETQIRHLFATTFLEQDNAFRAALNAKLDRARGVISGIYGIGQHIPGTLRGGMRTLSSEDYMFEYLEPQHRGNATQISNKWKASTEMVSFGEFITNSVAKDPGFLTDLDKMNGKVRVGLDDHEKWVQYLDADARKPYEIKAKGLNRFARDMDGGADFHTGNHESEPKHKGWSIFVMDAGNCIYSHSKAVKYFHHSSFLSGSPTKSAGTLRVDRGKITHVTMASGHYAPGKVQALAIARVLLVKFAAHSDSARAQTELGTVKLCPDFEQKDFYNALEYLKAGGDVTGLVKTAFPAKLDPIVALA
ncbi:MAG: hypothetical protein HYX47_04440 [Burkholderiales bacterium]|nr:hypothetical protein [Burkholderiales bacterium]